MRIHKTVLMALAACAAIGLLLSAPVLAQSSQRIVAPNGFTAEIQQTAGLSGPVLDVRLTSTAGQVLALRFSKSPVTPVKSKKSYVELTLGLDGVNSIKQLMEVDKQGHTNPKWVTVNVNGESVQAKAVPASPGSDFHSTGPQKLAYQMTLEALGRGRTAPFFAELRAAAASFHAGCLGPFVDLVTGATQGCTGKACAAVALSKVQSNLDLMSRCQ
jgi:hypothetical protein